jgi:hypothetical protein
MKGDSSAMEEIKQPGSASGEPSPGSRAHVFAGSSTPLAF